MDGTGRLIVTISSSVARNLSGEKLVPRCLPNVKPTELFDTEADECKKGNTYLRGRH